MPQIWNLAYFSPQLRLQKKNLHEGDQNVAIYQTYEASTITISSFRMRDPTRRSSLPSGAGGGLSVPRIPPVPDYVITHELISQLS